MLVPFRIICAAILLASIASIAQSAEIGFGYVGISCAHDDPLDAELKSDYADEVAGFTSVNHVCLTGNHDRDVAMLRATATHFAPLLQVEPFLFEFSRGQGRLNPEIETLWPQVRKTVADSGIDPAGIVFYLVDEPGLRGLPAVDVEAAAARVKRDFPASRTMIVEAFHAGGAPVIPTHVDLWGFDAYTIRDPAADETYLSHFRKAQAALLPHQNLALIGDGNFTPAHAEAGLLEKDMAIVAENYARFAMTQERVALLIFYTWPGGIDGLQEKGVRDMGERVIAAHKAMGRRLTGK